jgi:hypothetical protein
MAGSLKWMVYTTDEGTPYAVFVDESNGNANGFADYASATALLETLPRGIKMRYVNAISVTAGSPSSRQFYVGSLASDAWTAPTGLIANGITYRVTSKRGEKKRIPFPQDTALTDGSDT